MTNFYPELQDGHLDFKGNVEHLEMNDIPTEILGFFSPEKQGLINSCTRTIQGSGNILYKFYFELQNREGYTVILEKSPTDPVPHEVTE